MNGASLKQQTDANQARASDPGVSAWVSANAGTGKTTVLVNRVLRLLLHADEGGFYTRPENILCLTYTRAAAAEMENRLFGILSDWAVKGEAELAGALKDLRGEPATEDDMTRARRLFALTLDTKGGLKIHTIHAFCERLLHRFPVEAGVQADFKVLEDQERRALRDRAIDEVLGQGAADPGAPLGDALMRVIAATGEDGFRGIVEVALARQEEVRAMHLLADAHGSLADAERAGILAGLGGRADRSEMDIWRDMAAALSDADTGAALADIPPGKLTERGLLEALAKARAATAPELRARALREAFLTQDGKPRKTILTKDVREAFPELAARLEEAKVRVADCARQLAALHVASCTGALLTLADAIIGRYERAKAARAALDYDDLIVKTSRLLQGSSAAQWVLYKLDWGLDHILVDEAQDTSPPQWRVIRALAGEFFAGEGARERERTVFAVGDEKQSIYSFQGADPASFAAHGRAFEQAASAAGKPWARVPLTVSFRSTEPVLKSVDELFALEDARDGVVWDEPIVHQAVRAGQAGLVELWPVEEPDEYEPAHAMRPFDEMAVAAHARDRLAERIADTIRHWLDSGERLEARNRAMRPGDILILVRSRDAFVHKLIHAFKSRGIPVAGADRMRLTEQLAVMDLVALAEFVLLPDDDLNLATLLKSPLVGLSDDDLFELAHGRKGALWNALRDKAGEKPRYAETAALLTRWLNRADLDPPYEFFAGLLEENGMQTRRALISRLGPDAGDALDEFLNLALDYERVSHPSLQGFLDWLRKGEAEVKRDMEQGRDEVRIMTAHGAKGLEANVVILPDTCRGPSVGGNKPKLLPLPRVSAPPGAPGHLVWAPPGAMPLDAIEEAKETLREADRAEQNRLLYVAMTRARDRLYVAGWKGGNKLTEHCWYALVSEGLKGLLEPADGALGDEVLRFEDRGDGKSTARDDEVDAPPVARELPDWAVRAAPHEDPPSLPLTPSAIAAGAGGDGAQLAEQDVIGPLARAEDNRFLRGNLIHALLQHLPDIEPERREETARALTAARGRDLDQDQRETIVSETLRVLANEDWAALFAPGSLAEAPIAARIDRPGQETLELAGQIDRLVVTDDEVLIIDYKTNRPPAKSPEETAPLYRRQLAAYRHVLGNLYPDKRIRAALLWTDTADLMWMPDALLDEAAREAGLARGGP